MARSHLILGLLPAITAALSEPVTIDNFLRAESHGYMAKTVRAGGLGRFVHSREVTSIDTSPSSAPTHGQSVIRMNRDTLYSMLVLDLTSPATVTFPDVGGRFVSFGFISDTHDVFPAAYEPGKYLVTQNACSCSPPCRSAGEDGLVCTAFGTRFAFLILRMLADAANATDMGEAHKAQDGFHVEQASAGVWEVPEWNATDLATVRQHLLALKQASTAPPAFGFFSGPEAVDHLYGVLSVASGWGGTRQEDQSYTFWLPQSPGSYTLTMTEVPVDGNGFWSITVYNEEGFMFAYPSNYNSAAQGASGLNADGSTTVYFGNCDDPLRQRPSKAHCLPVQPGWNMVTRFFRPGAPILAGSWRCPEPVLDALKESSQQDPARGAEL